MHNVERALDSLGIDYVERNDNAQALCPMHERMTGQPDHNPSWYIHMETGQHICFSCGYKGNLIQLVCDVNELYLPDSFFRNQYDYKAGEAWLVSHIEVTIAELKEAFSSIPKYTGPPPKPLRMSEARLAIYVSPTEQALASRNVTAEAAEKYGVLWNKNTDTWILPLRDADTNLLLGWQEKGTTDRTFKNRPAGIQKSLTLFGIDVQKKELAIVVESPLDCLRIESAGYSGAVATCGAILSETQAKLLRASEKVIAAFDNPNIDDAGRKASAQLRSLASKYGINLWFFNYGTTDKKDPGDMTDEEIAWGISNAKLALLGESAYVYGDTKALSN